MTTDLLPLANANAHQLTEKGVKGDWLIRENLTDRELATFDARVTDQDIMAMLRFAREYEVAAFNTGIDFQKEKQNTATQDRIDRLLAERRAMIARNDELADALDRLTKGES